MASARVTVNTVSSVNRQPGENSGNLVVLMGRCLYKDPMMSLAMSPDKIAYMKKLYLNIGREGKGRGRPDGGLPLWVL